MLPIIRLFIRLQERVDITKDVLSKGFTLESMRELVPLDRMAIVASLQLRARSILGQNYDPLLVESMSSIQVEVNRLFGISAQKVMEINASIVF